MPRSDGEPNDHDHHRGHHHDQGWRAVVRYLRHGRRMWDSDVNRAAVELVDPRPGEVIVDIGAGFGPAVVHVARRGADAVAVEPTPWMRRTLGVRRRLRRDPGAIRVVAGTAELLPLDDGSVDAVMSVNTMHHWSEPGRAVGELARVVRPGGRVVLVDEAFDDPTHPRFDPDAAEQHHDRHDFLDIDPSEMAGQLATAGFVEVEGDTRRLGGAPVVYVSGIRAG